MDRLSTRIACSLMRSLGVGATGENYGIGRGRSQGTGDRGQETEKKSDSALSPVSCPLDALYTSAMLPEEAAFLDRVCADPEDDGPGA